MKIDYVKLEAEAPEGWFSQYDMKVLVPEVQKLKPGQKYVEVGVYKGRSLWVARKFADPKVEMWGVDILEDPRIPGVTFYKSDSHEAAKLFNDDSIDLIFIDANHDYEFVKGDIEHYYPKMVKGGVMLFHDCDETSPGVVRAVTEFCQTNDLRVELFKSSFGNTSIAKVQL